MEMCSKLWFLGVILILWLETNLCNARRAIPTKAGSAICTLSKKLKDVTPWATQQLDEEVTKITNLELKLLEWQSKFLQSKSKGRGYETCRVTGPLFRQMRKEVDKAREEVEKLEREATKAYTFAANSAGRLDEFITVFANAKNEGGNGYCLGDTTPATIEELNSCFSGKDFREESLVDISEKASEQEPNIGGAIEGIKYSALSSTFSDGSNNANCSLIKGSKNGVLENVDLEKSLWWGGGILTISKGFEGIINESSFGPGEISSAQIQGGSSKAYWTADPAKQIVHLKDSLEAIKAFKDAKENIQTKIEGIEQQIQFCLGEQEHNKHSTEPVPTEQNATQPNESITEQSYTEKTTSEQNTTETPITCFENAAQIVAQLKEKRALLTRYRKVKGWIPPNSAFIPTPRLGLLLTFL
ncbi:Transferrin receptor-like, ESAG6-like [Trypanosoma congolense IL3000]|uniref:Transferrin receptor-like, ESAG6-like n=1 Tax=Trypanosoma congolense (strain IL3000) TaxID=1068625 RepID=F9WFS0_TRYCI|nr:Transferrin receptor-like, ESAG6-like [Trypanosoma congolense IL3000]